MRISGRRYGRRRIKVAEFDPCLIVRNIAENFHALGI